LGKSPRPTPITAEAPDNVFCLFELQSGWTGVFHTPRIFHPALKGTGYDGFQAFGTEGNLAFGAGHRASIFSTRRHLLPEVSEDGWYHVPNGPIDWSKAKWPIPPKGARNYYHESTAHLFDCIRQDREPLCGIDWGLHITEIMYGAMESSRTGRHYDLETSVDW
jgi:predicted dehydrogenase